MVGLRKLTRGQRKRAVTFFRLRDDRGFLSKTQFSTPRLARKQKFLFRNTPTTEGQIRVVKTGFKPSLPIQRTEREIRQRLNRNKQRVSQFRRGRIV